MSMFIFGHIISYYGYDDIIRTPYEINDSKLVN